MSLFKLAWANLLYRKFSAFISILLLAFGVGLVSLLLNTSKVLESTLLNSIQGVDMVVGAKGSPIQLILANIYHIDDPTGNIDLKQADGLLRNPMISSSVKLSYGDFYQKYRILGASTSIYSFYDLKVSSGKKAEEVMEVVVGADVAAAQGLKPGSIIESSHGAGNGEKHHENYKVVGVLKSSGTVLDGLIITPLESIWEVHHTTENRQITAVLIKFRNAMGLMTVPAMVNKNTSLMAALPAIEVNRLMTLFGSALELLYYLALVIVVIAILSVFFSLLNSLRERKMELALLRLQGASRGRLFGSILVEAFFIAIIGSVIGLLISKLVFELLVGKYAGGMQLDGTGSIFGYDLILIPASIVIACMAAVFPAWSACRVSITTLLRDK